MCTPYLFEIEIIRVELTNTLENLPKYRVSRGVLPRCYMPRMSLSLPFVRLSPIDAVLYIHAVDGHDVLPYYK